MLRLQRIFESQIEFRFRRLIATTTLLVLVAGCWSAPEKEVIVYTALDQEFSQQIFDDFQQETGITVTAKFDDESTKTVGLVNAIIREKNRPRCDLFWNNEILHTLRLEQMGILEVYRPSAADKYPQEYRSEDGLWYGFAARVRVLIVNTDLVPADQRPDSIQDLADPKWKGRAGIAKPLFGTTASHAAVLFAAWGEEPAKEYFRQVKQNTQILSGNKQVALAVGSGQLAFGLTDTDDAIIELEKGMPVEIVYPDQQEGGLGALRIPNTICLIKGSKNSQRARQLVDYLLGADVEARLAHGPSAQFPLRADVSITPRVQGEQEIKWMKVDFKAAAEQWDQATKFLKNEFATAQ